MTTRHSAHRGPTHYDDVVGVEVTIDGMLVIADRLNLMDFPVALGIRLNIPQLELRDIVWEQMARDLTAQGVLDIFGEPHPEVAAMVDTLSRADRTLEGRWWRRDVGGKMVRFVVCRKGDPPQSLAGAGHLHRYRDRRIDHRRRDRRCAAGVSSDEADSRTGGRRSDSRRHSLAAVDRQRL
jgi:hypothetical protein